VRRTFLILVLAAGLSACATNSTDASGDTATADTATADTATADTATADTATKKPKMRCYREKNTGFRLGGKRVCEPVDE